MTIYPSFRTLPYVYRCTHKTSGEFYIGVRWANTVPSTDDIGVFYFSSSKRVKPRFHEFVAEIIAEFFNKEDAFWFEQQLITESWHDPACLNRQYKTTKGDIRFKCTGHTNETRLKISMSRKGKAPWNRGMSGIAVPALLKSAIARRGIPLSDEHKAKVSAALTGIVRGRQSDDHRQKLSDIKMRAYAEKQPTIIKEAHNQYSLFVSEYQKTPTLNWWRVVSAERSWHSVSVIAKAFGSWAKFLQYCQCSTTA